MAPGSAPTLPIVIRTRPLVSPILVGRDDLLDLADRRIGEALGGRGQFLLISGEAGVGKTRLLGAVERKAAAAGFRTVRAGAYPSDLQVAAAILIDLARQMGRSDVLEPIGRTLAERLDDGAAPSPDPRRRRRLLVLDVAELLADLALAGPTMIALEDVHWSDDLTLEIIEALARRVPDCPLFLVATYRTDELFPRAPLRDWRARLVGQRRAEEIRVARLSEADTARMATYLGGTDLPVARDVAAAIHARTDGIPLHIEELLAVLGGSDAAGPVGVRDAGVPETVEDTILARLDSRSAEAQAIARAGAVIGRAFDLDILAAVVDRPTAALSPQLAELADHFVLLQSTVSGRFGFRHALICDAIYDRIPEPERRRLHARVADAAVGTGYGTDAFLALHFERAGRPADAFAAALDGAASATAISSHGEARELYACALRTAPADLGVAARARLQEALGIAAAASDDNTAADAAFRAARTAYLEAGDQLAAAAVVAPLAAVRHLLGDSLEARSALIRGALGEIDHGPSLHGASLHPESDRVRGRLLAALSAAYMLDRRLTESIELAGDARDLAHAVEDLPTAIDAATTLGACLVFAGRMEEGWALLEGQIETAKAGQLEAAACRAYRMLGTSASVLLDYPRAERWLRDGIADAERVALWNHRHYMAAHLAHVLWATGRWTEAAEQARHALADGRGGITTRISALHVLGFVALGRDELSDAVASLSEARQLGEQMGELQRFSPAMWGLAEVALAGGDAATAIQLANDALRASVAVGDAAYLFPFIVTGARAHLAAGDPQSARAWLAASAEPIRARQIPGTLVAVEHGEALLALASGSTGQAREALASVVADWAALGRTWEGTWALIDLARANLRSNRRADAGRIAAQAAAAATDLGAPALIAAAEAILAQARGRTPGAEPWSPLTAREFEVARLVADGLTNPAIAAELDIAPKTVAAHVEHILAKLSVARRAEIAAWTASVTVLHSRPPGGDREE